MTRALTGRTDSYQMTPLGDNDTSKVYPMCVAAVFKVWGSCSGAPPRIPPMSIVILERERAHFERWHVESIKEKKQQKTLQLKKISPISIYL
jgi:hypothetical protein